MVPVAPEAALPALHQVGELRAGEGDLLTRRRQRPALLGAVVLGDAGRLKFTIKQALLDAERATEALHALAGPLPGEDLLPLRLSQLPRHRCLFPPLRPNRPGPPPRADPPGSAPAVPARTPSPAPPTGPR